MVDMVAPKVIGHYLLDREIDQLTFWSRSKSLWLRRIAIMATWPRIKQLQFQSTLDLARLYIHDDEDLIHKATGWMLREIGKRDPQVLFDFIQNHPPMPRVMRRYALEKFPAEIRARFK